MVTVVIPCYNASSYIDKCINNLSAQTYRDFKVIFVDDKSTDNTYDLLLKLQCSSSLHITVLQNVENSGPAFCRNKGILVATTKYITFCDCDDWYDCDFIEKMLQLLESNAADISLCGYKIVDEKGNVKNRPIYNKTGMISREEVFALDADSVCMMMVKTDIMKDTLLPNLRNGEDAATVPLLLAKSSKYAVTTECIYNYFRRQGSASQTPSLKVVESLISSYNFIKEQFPSKYLKELEFLGVKNVLYAAIITLFSFSYDKSLAKKIINEYEQDFPNWFRNPYLKSLRTYKKIVLILIHCRLLLLIKLISSLRNIIIR